MKHRQITSQELADEAKEFGEGLYKLNSDNNESRNDNMSSKEMVNHPEHYNELKVKGEPIEAIDLIKTFASMDGIPSYDGFLLGTIIKYLSRYPFKENPTQDLEKAQWYLQKLVDEVKNETNGKGI